MKILVIGGGGREAALVHKISQSKKVTKLFCAPGNAGIAKHATCVPIAVNQIDQLLQFAKENQIDLTVVGPEIPLSLGIVDLFQKEGLRIFGPNQQAAQIESSKAFSKKLMQKYQIPTPEAEVVSINEAYEKIGILPMPIVLKVDGLAAGKGVVIAQNPAEAKAGLDYFKSIGASDSPVLLERYLIGVEATFLVIVDRDEALPLSSAKDHKTLLDDNRGPNTGGMGAISPSPLMTPAMTAEVMSKIIHPTVAGLVKQGISYQGVLYAGLMLTDEGPYVLEFNARLGDPETQAVLPRLKTDIVILMEAVLSHRLNQLKLEWDDAVSVCVVLASNGYPGDYEKGKMIRGMKEINDPSVMIFHAGTKMEGDHCLTDGGRVLGVTALGCDYQTARAKSYQAIHQIAFEGMIYRKDIGKAV